MNVGSTQHTYIYQSASLLTFYSESLRKGFVVKEIKINGKLIDFANLTPEKLAIIQKLAFERFNDLNESDLKLNENFNKPGDLQKSEDQIKSDSSSDGNYVVGTKEHNVTHTIKKDVNINKVTQETLFFNETSALAMADLKEVSYDVNSSAQEILNPSIYSDESELDGKVGIEFTLTTCPAPFGNDDVVSPSSITLDYTLDHSKKVKDLIGTQVVTRSETLESSLTLCNNMIVKLQLLKDDTQRLLKKANDKDRPPLLNKLHEINEKLEFYVIQKEKITNYETNAPESKKGWLTSEYFRNSIRQLTKDGSDFDTAKKNYIAVPPNMRQQKLEGDDVSVQYGRTGVISDMRNGWVSYQDLEQMVEQSENGQISLTQVQAKLGELEKEKVEIEKSRAFTKSSKQKKDNQLQSVQGAINELIFLKKMIMNLNEAKQADRQEDVDLALEGINSTLRNRELVLEQQMMVYLQDQFANNPEYINKCIAEGKSIDVIHVGLLNMGIKKTDSTGWRHDEHVQMEDMNAIFKKFHGKKLVFASSGGPLIGDDALVFSIPGVNAGQSTLGTYFFNTSVQGDRKNSGPQHQNNMNTVLSYRVAKFREGENYEFIDDIAYTLQNEKKTDYALATKLVRTFRDENQDNAKALVSYGCVSAKDRSAVVGEMLMQQPLKAKLIARGKDVEAFFRKHLFSSEGAAIKIIRENLTPHSALKTKPFDLPIRFQSQLWEAMKALGRKLIGRKGSD